MQRHNPTNINFDKAFATRRVQTHVHKLALKQYQLWTADVALTLYCFLIKVIPYHREYAFPLYCYHVNLKLLNSQNDVAKHNSTLQCLIMSKKKKKQFFCPICSLHGSHRRKQDHIPTRYNPFCLEGEPEKPDGENFTNILSRILSPKGKLSSQSKRHDFWIVIAGLFS